MFDRPVFTGNPRRGPRQSFIKGHGLSKDSLPVEFADAFFPMYENKERDNNGDPMLSMEYLTRNTNMRANLAFAGEATYDEWSGPFSVKELRQHLGLYIMNGLSPSPQLDFKFDPNDKANYNPFISENLGSTGNPQRRLKQFKAFFGCQDPLKPTPDRKASPLFKVLSIVKWIRRVGPLSWECGVNLGLDEQTVGFQGHHVDKMRITYKTEGDGFQCDALCDDGFTYSIFFRNEPPPLEYVRAGLSPLHARSLWLLDQLRRDYHHVWVDNLCMSAKFAKAGFTGKNKTMLSGVTRVAKRGIPKMVVQDQVKNENDIVSVRGTIKAAVLEGDSAIPDLVAMIVYDNKPVHFLSMTCTSIKWIEKTRSVWNQEEKEMVDINFLRVNLIDDYNNKMNAVDISDQLRNNYRMTLWLRHRKWWWSIYMYGMGVLLTNAYKVYTRTMDNARVPNSQRLTHYGFLLSIGTAWVDREETDIRHIKRVRERKKRQQEKQQQQTPVTPTPLYLHGTRKRTAVTNLTSPKTPSKAPRINNNSLHPNTGSLRCRLNHFGCFHSPMPSQSKHPSCALHRWLMGRDPGSHSQIRGHIVCCTACKVNLCTQCFHVFHTVKDIVGEKVELSSMLLD